MGRQWHSEQWVSEPSGSAAPGTPTLTVADQADGTGATATVADSDGGITNTIYTQVFDGEFGSGTWTDSGSRAGDGTVDLSLAVGHYLAYCLSDNGTATSVSSPVYFAVTDSSVDSILYQILTGVQSRVRAASVAGVASGSVIVKKLELSRIYRQLDGVTFPAVLITPGRQVMNPRAGTTTQDDVEYRVLVTIMREDNQEPTIEANLNAQTLAYEVIAKAFRNQRLSGVTEVTTCAVDASDVVIPPAWHKNLLASAMMLRFTSREGRGI